LKRSSPNHCFFDRPATGDSVDVDLSITIAVGGTAIAIYEPSGAAGWSAQ
jgi:hypothetical protein